MERRAAFEIHEIDPGLAFQQGSEHFDVALFRRDHQRRKTGFVRASTGSAGVDQFAHNFPFLL